MKGPAGPESSRVRNMSGVMGWDVNMAGTKYRYYSVSLDGSLLFVCLFVGAGMSRFRYLSLFGLENGV